MLLTGFSVNPILTSNAAGSFGVTSDGVVQGVAYDDPSARNYLTNTTLANTETLPMWGGVAITENIGLTTGGGPTSARALNVAGISGFSVFNQAHAMINTQTSPVPLALPGMTVPMYRFGSNARIAVAIDPALVSLDGGPITQQVSWDFNLQRLVPYEAAQAGIATTAVSWSSGIVTVTTASPHGLVVGDDPTLAGIVPAAYNGDVTVLTVPSSTTFTYALATNPGSATTQGTLVAGGGLLNVRVLTIIPTGNMTVNFDGTNATWNRNGPAAIILL